VQRPIRRLLIANRGEIALRIQRACRELGIEVVQVYTEADRESLPVRLADRACCIGRARSDESYLNAEFLVSAALSQKADAIHPGYGFLSENAAFARLCELEGVIFVGPRADAIEAMGDKATARKLALETSIPVTPGSAGKLDGLDEARAVARELGYPVLLKAAAGGGGRGMRVVETAAALAAAYVEAAHEAKAAFGDDSLYMERFLPRVRHIEVQVLGDGRTVLHLGERDCSIQRRNQKLLEEGRSPALGEAQRARLYDAAVRLCRYAGYSSAGTVEFILDEGSGEFYFIEMNTRIQVEHPVTEMVTGIDLVKAQIRIAAGEPLALKQDAVPFVGHALECRINAEDAERDFAPCPGRITRFHAPGGPGIRVDSHAFAGYAIPPYYDSLLAKLIAWGRDRGEALARMERALGEMEIEGVQTTLAFHRDLLANEEFRAGRVYTRFVEQELLKTT
jgi:acetyl-CoA carboxylase biotin carboxylase subunit